MNDYTKVREITPNSTGTCNRCGEDWVGEDLINAVYFKHSILAVYDLPIKVSNTNATYLRTTCPRCHKTLFRILDGATYIALYAYMIKNGPKPTLTAPNEKTEDLTGIEQINRKFTILKTD